MPGMVSATVLATEYELDSKLVTVADWDEPFKKGVIYYLSDDHIRGVLLWNMWNSVPPARLLIGESGPLKLSSLTGRLASKGKDVTALVAAESR